MPVSIVRTPEEVERVLDKAREVAFKAQDEGDTDDTAEAVYETLQWLTGNTDNNPAEYLLGDE